jgi:hypothetical protein
VCTALHGATEELGRDAAPPKVSTILVHVQPTAIDPSNGTQTSATP